MNRHANIIFETSTVQYTNELLIVASGGLEILIFNQASEPALV